MIGRIPWFPAEAFPGGPCSLPFYLYLFHRTVSGGQPLLAQGYEHSANHGVSGDDLRLRRAQLLDSDSSTAWAQPRLS